jgi:site-specific recombinase XerD
VTDPLLELGTVPNSPLDELLASWLRRLRAEHKSPHTLKGYQRGVQGFLDFCAAEHRPAELTRDAVVDYIGSRGGQASTAGLHLKVLKLFARWLADEEGFDAAPITALHPPKTDQPAVPDLSGAELDRLLKVCDGRTLVERRDRALLVLFAETGLRAAEMRALDVGDVDPDGCVLHVRRGKGGKGRRVHFSPGAAAVLDRYLRARRLVVGRPAEGPLWISRAGRRLSYNGMAGALKARAEQAGVPGFHLHRLRHTAATRWLRAGGSETGLRAHAGWSSNTMIGHYVKAASEALAGEEFNRLGLGVVEL